MNVRFEGFSKKGLAFIDEDQAADLDNVIVEESDVLFNITGASIGRVCLAPPEMAKARVNQHVCIIRPTQHLLPSFLSFFLSSTKQQGAIQNNQSGGTRQALTKKQITEWEIPLPALSEQHRIVEILEQADNLRRLRTDADSVAERVLPALFREMFGNPASNPKRHRSGVLGDIITEAAYGTSVQSNTDSRGVAVIRMNSITTGGALDLKDLKYVVLPNAELDKQRLQAGDLLFNRTNTRELVGKTGLWRGGIEAVAASYLIRLRVDENEAIPEYIWAWLNTPFLKQKLFEVARRAAGMANINTKEIRSLPLVLPSKAQQEKFAKAMLPLELNTSQRDASQKNLETLFQALLHRAFTGDLTAGWREAHTKELLDEMEQQTKTLPSPSKAA